MEIHRARVEKRKWGWHKGSNDVDTRGQKKARTTERELEENGQRKKGTRWDGRAGGQQRMLPWTGHGGEICASAPGLCSMSSEEDRWSEKTVEWDTVYLRLIIFSWTMTSMSSACSVKHISNMHWLARSTGKIANAIDVIVATIWNRTSLNCRIQTECSSRFERFF